MENDRKVNFKIALNILFALYLTIFTSSSSGGSCEDNTGSSDSTSSSDSLFDCSDTNSSSSSDSSSSSSSSSTTTSTPTVTVPTGSGTTTATSSNSTTGTNSTSTYTYKDEDNDFDCVDDSEERSADPATAALPPALITNISAINTVIDIYLDGNNVNTTATIQAKITLRQSGITGSIIPCIVSQVTPSHYQLTGFNLSGLYFLAIQSGAFKTTSQESQPVIFRLDI